MTEPRVVLRVVSFLGVIGCLLAVGVIGLTLVALKEGKLDSAAVALVAGVSSLAGVTLGALGSMLATAHSQPAGTPADPVNVALPDQPVVVTPTAPEPDAPAESDL